MMKFANFLLYFLTAILLVNCNAQKGASSNIPVVSSNIMSISSISSLSIGSTYQVNVQGGLAPYTYSLFGVGSLKNATYSAGSVAGSATITITDSLKQTITMNFVVVKPSVPTTSPATGSNGSTPPAQPTPQSGPGTNSSIAYNGAPDDYSDEPNMRFRKGLSSFNNSALQLVPTYNSIGIYWPARTGTISSEGKVQYRVFGTSTWQSGLSLWLDTRNNEFRGSLVSLKSGTKYEVRTFANDTDSEIATVTTWSDSVPVSRTIYIPIGTSSTTFVADQSGTAAGYVVYTVAPPPAVSSQIDMGVTDIHTNANCVDIRASYVIIRGLTLKNCQKSGIRIMEKSHHVIIEENDISGFGSGNGNGTAVVGLSSAIIPGTEYDAGVYCNNYSTPISDKVTQVTIQRNKIHHPRYGSIHWGYAHPNATQGMTFSHCGPNNVFRYNEIYSSQGHFFNDGIGGLSNFSFEGFPNADSDIYGNKISEVYDDAIESEGGNRNVRIWGNYMHHTYVKIALATTAVGPLYAFRNIAGECAGLANPNLTLDEAPCGLFFKVGSQDPLVRGGRTYIFHNTSLQAAAPASTSLYATGDSGAINMAGGPVYNIITRNNIFTSSRDWWTIIRLDYSFGASDIDYDLYIGSLSSANDETHGIKKYPIFSADLDPGLIKKSYPDLGTTYKALFNYEATKDPSVLGNFTLTTLSPGYHAGLSLPNFNDQYPLPDMGAHQSGTPAMQFGVNAYRP